MNLRALAEKDLAFTLEGSCPGGACEILFTDMLANEHSVQGRVGDIGFSYDTDGNQISTRQVWVTWRMSNLVDEHGKYIEPKRGWMCEYADLSGKRWTAYVTRYEPDRTIGIGRVWLSFDLGMDDGGD